MSGTVEARDAGSRDSTGRHDRARRTVAISRIAAAIDGFPEGRDAAALGHLLAQATGAQLMLATVHTPPLVPMPPELGDAALRKQSRRLVRQVRDSCAPGATTVTATDHSVPRSLQRVVHRHNRDLLVVGSSRLAPEGRVRIGKRTRQLLCNLECALAVAPRGMHLDPRPLRRIGVGYDGGPESEAALALAASIAVGAGAELLVQAVVDDRLPGRAWPGLAGVLGLTWDDVIQTEIDRVRAQAVIAGELSEAQLDVKRGRPADALLAMSETIDLLVIGSRRWGPAARMLLGSTGEAVMHDAACAVLAVPRPGR
jgi:nucleotide-binding universal stress UspA family protein